MTFQWGREEVLLLNGFVLGKGAQGLKSKWIEDICHPFLFRICCKILGNYIENQDQHGTDKKNGIVSENNRQAV